MINFIRGTLISIEDDLIVVENNGIGYEIFLSTKDIEKILDKINSEILVYTYFIHKEDNMALFGFLNKETKKFFKELLKVDGIGPKLATKILGSATPEEISKYIEEENIDMLKRIPGIGQKMVGKRWSKVKDLELEEEKNKHRCNNFKGMGRNEGNMK